MAIVTPELSLINLTQQIEQFVSCIWEPPDVIELRRINGERVQQRWCRAVDIVSELKQLQQENAAGWQVYAGANPRPSVGATGDTSIKLARCIFVDFDHVTVEAALATIRASGLPEPTIVVASGHGCHAYWRLTEPMTDLAAWSAIQQDLIDHLHTDPKIKNPERIMRLPGFLNLKAEPVECQIVEADTARVYDLDLLVAAIPERQDGTDDKASAPVADRPVRPGLDALARAAKYLQGIPPAVEGQHGDDQTFGAACRMRDFGLSEDQALALLSEWNRTCNPPWSDRHLRAKVQHAYKYAKGEPGSKITEPLRRQPQGRVVSTIAAAVIRTRVVEPYKPFPPEALPTVVRHLVEEGAAALGCDPSCLAYAGAAGSGHRQFPSSSPEVVLDRASGGVGRDRRPQWYA
jgi:hypothetical protein